MRKSSFYFLQVDLLFLVLWSPLLYDIKALSIVTIQQYV